MTPQKCQKCETQLYVTLKTKSGHQGTAKRVARGAVFITGRIKLSTATPLWSNIEYALCIQCSHDGLRDFMTELFATAPHPSQPEPALIPPKRKREFPCRGCRIRFAYDTRRDRHERLFCANQVFRRETLTQWQSGRGMPVASVREDGQVDQMFRSASDALNGLDPGDRCLVPSCPLAVDDSVGARTGYCRLHWGVPRPSDAGYIEGVHGPIANTITK